MTDKEFVLSIYPKAVSTNLSEVGVRYIHTGEDTAFLGYCIGKTEEETWAYAVDDIKYEMVKKLAQ